jgi:hypothetical protein
MTDPFTMKPATEKQVRADYKRQGYEVRINKPEGHIRFREPGGFWREGRYVSEYRIDDRGNVHLI